ncbi:HAD-IA family hydrolase [Dactylosporangium sp. NPDC050588]|uniref:HAD family hydrolase n=1 Tax=Dactylosporangium sp. NPDC050588 TaxID=3157211 RepID=UPI0033FE978F
MLDFDGPICSIFARYPAPKVARHLVSVLQAKDVGLPTTVVEETDPLEVLRWTGVNCPKALVVAVEEALCAAERRAAEIASPTPHGHDVIRAAWRSGVPTAIVSNNSAGAITAYLVLHQLAECVAAVIGRHFAEPSEMKPNPAPILSAVRALKAEPNDCVLVGDSLSDIEGAAAAGVRAIGYANRPWKVTAFRAADVVVTSMSEVLEYLGT